MSLRKVPAWVTSRVDGRTIASSVIIGRTAGWRSDRYHTVSYAAESKNRGLRWADDRGERRLLDRGYRLFSSANERSARATSPTTKKCGTVVQLWNLVGLHFQRGLALNGGINFLFQPTSLPISGALSRAGITMVKGIVESERSKVSSLKLQFVLSLNLPRSSLAHAP